MRPHDVPIRFALSLNLRSTSRLVRAIRHGQVKNSDLFLILKRTISIGKGARLHGASFGAGANVHVEVQVPFTETVSTSLISATLDQVDHKTLGLDFDIGAEPTLLQLALWIRREMETQLGPKVSPLQVRLITDDGRSAVALLER